MPVPRKFCLGNPESWALESGKQLKESGIPLTIEIQNPSYTDKDRNTVPGTTARDPQSKNVLYSVTWGKRMNKLEVD